MSRYSEIVILCEDRQQEVFARHFLVNCGIERQRIRVRHYPSGRGSAEQHVRQQYPVEVRAYRSRCGHLAIALVVMTDADTHSLQERLSELDEELVRLALPTRQANERIGVFIPKRSIETWIRYLQGEQVDEDTRYPRLESESDCRPAVEDLARRRYDPLPVHAPPSLQAACAELGRILPY